jgi:predicted RNA binding protein YcfA (HicA-like mRNA interferase family)
MAKLPAVSGKDAVRAFEGAGFVVARIVGSHHIMRKAGHPLILTVPVHRNQDVATGTLRSLISAAGLTVEEFLKFL